MWFMMERIQNSFTLSERLLRVLNRSNATPTYFAGNAFYAGDSIEQLIAEGVDVNQASGNLLPLQCACVSGDVSCVKLLLDNGAKVNNYDGYRRAALHYAAEKSAPCVDVLLNYGADPNIRDGNGCAPLHWAAYKNRPACARRLLESGANPDASDFNSDTPLSVAAFKGHLETLRVLLDFNCDVHVTNVNGYSPFLRLLQTIAVGIGSAQDDACLALLLKASGIISLRNARTGSVMHNLANDRELKLLLDPYCTQARPLAQLARYAVRRACGSGYLPDRVDRLPLPRALRNYVSLRD